MILINNDRIPGQKITKVLGLVKGNTIRARNIGNDILAIFRNLAGGEVKEYTKMLAEAREQALDRMVEDAKKKGANGIINIRFATSTMMLGAADILFLGTAVIFSPDNE
jgi:uncharacterized protein YbjQ (UPF0145 family)